MRTDIYDLVHSYNPDEYDQWPSYDPDNIDEFECGYVAGLEMLLRELMAAPIKADLTDLYKLHEKILRHLGDIE